MTILLDFSLIAPGGSSTYAHSFLEALSERGDLNDVAVLIPHGTRQLERVVSKLQQHGATVTSLALGSGWRSALRRQTAVPIHSARVHAHVVFSPRETAPLLVPTALVILARNLKAWPTTAARLELHDLRGKSRRIVSWLSARRAAKVLAVSHVMANALPARIAESAVVIHHGCDLDLVPRSRLDNGPPGIPLRIVALGAVSRHKRHDTLIDSVAALHRLGQKATLDIWGPVADHTWANELRQKGHNLLGFDPLRGSTDRSNRQSILAAADVLAVISSFESFGHPFVEGMRTSCIIWAPDSQIVDELCETSAVTFSEGAPEIAARALLEALPSAPKRLAFGRIRSQEFTWASTVDQTMQELRAVADRSRRTRAT